MQSSKLVIGSGGYGKVVALSSAEVRKTFFLSNSDTDLWFSPQVLTELLLPCLLGGLENLVPAHGIAVVCGPKADPKASLLMPRFTTDAMKLKFSLRDKRMTVDQTLGMLRDVSFALAQLHSRKIVHRDVKLVNILTGDGSSFSLADFGLARIGRPTVKLEDTVLSSHCCLSPEMIWGCGEGCPSDVFALGCCALDALLYEVAEFPIRRGDPVTQAFSLLRFFGTPPSPEQWSEITSLPFFWAANCPQFKPSQAWRDLRCGEDTREVAELIEAACQWNPSRRPTAAELCAAVELALANRKKRLPGSPVQPPPSARQVAARAGSRGGAVDVLVATVERTLGASQWDQDENMLSNFRKVADWWWRTASEREKEPTTSVAALAYFITLRNLRFELPPFSQMQYFCSAILLLVSALNDAYPLALGDMVYECSECDGNGSAEIRAAVDGILGDPDRRKWLLPCLLCVQNHTSGPGLDAPATERWCLDCLHRWLDLGTGPPTSKEEMEYLWGQGVVGSRGLHHATSVLGQAPFPGGGAEPLDVVTWTREVHTGDPQVRYEPSITPRDLASPVFLRHLVLRLLACFNSGSIQVLPELHAYRKLFEMFVSVPFLEQVGLVQRRFRGGSGLGEGETDVRASTKATANRVRQGLYLVTQRFRARDGVDVYIRAAHVRGTGFAVGIRSGPEAAQLKSGDGAWCPKATTEDLWPLLMPPDADSEREEPSRPAKNHHLGWYPTFGAWLLEQKLGIRAFKLGDGEKCPGTTLDDLQQYVAPVLDATPPPPPSRSCSFDPFSEHKSSCPLPGPLFQTSFDGFVSTNNRKKRRLLKVGQDF